MVLGRTGVAKWFVGTFPWIPSRGVFGKGLKDTFRAGALAGFPKASKAGPHENPMNDVTEGEEFAERLNLLAGVICRLDAPNEVTWEGWM